MMKTFTLLALVLFGSASAFVSPFSTPAVARVTTTKPQFVLASETDATEAASAEVDSTENKIERPRFTAFVGNLAFDNTIEDVKKLFSEHGKVELVTLPRDRETQQARGFAFVDMGSEEEMEKAIEGLNGFSFNGRTLRVSKSVAKEELQKQPRKIVDDRVDDGMMKIYVGNIPFDATKAQLMDFYEKYGAVSEVYIPLNGQTGEGRGFAFVTMKEEDAVKAIEATNGVEFAGRNLVVNKPLPPGEKAPARLSQRTKLYIGNLSFYTVPETLTEIFEEFGEVYDCYFPEDPATGGSRGFGFVTMSKKDAQKAIDELDGAEVDGRVIRVNEAKPKGGQRRRPQNEDSFYDDE